MKVSELAVSGERVMSSALTIVTAPSGTEPPTVPFIAISPVPAVKLRAPGPFTALEKVIDCPLEEVLIEGVPLKVMGAAKETGCPAAIEPEKATAPLPDCDNPAESVTVPAKVKIPVLAMIIGPLFVVVSVLVLSKWRLLPVNWNPPPALVETLLLN